MLKGGTGGGGRLQGEKVDGGWLVMVQFCLFVSCFGYAGTPHYDGRTPLRWGLYVGVGFWEGADREERKVPWPNRARCTWIINLITNKQWETETRAREAESGKHTSSRIASRAKERRVSERVRERAMHL